MLEKKRKFKQFGPGTVNKCIVQWWFKKFCKGNEILEDKESSGWPLEVDKDKSRRSSKLIFLQLHEKLVKNSILTILWSFNIWSKLINGCLMSWSKIKKNSRFEVSSLFLCNNELFIDWIVTCNEKWILFGKFWKRWEYQTTRPASWEICMQVRKQQLKLDMEQQTGSK